MPAALSEKQTKATFSELAAQRKKLTEDIAVANNELAKLTRIREEDETEAVIFARPANAKLTPLIKQKEDLLLSLRRQRDAVQRAIDQVKEEEEVDRAKLAAQRLERFRQESAPHVARLHESLDRSIKATQDFFELFAKQESLPAFELAAFVYPEQSRPYDPEHPFPAPDHKRLAFLTMMNSAISYLRSPGVLS